MQGQTIQPSTLRVKVLNVKGDVIENAKVTLRPGGSKAKAIGLAFDRQSATYAAKVPVGTAQLEVRHKHLQGQTREVSVGATPSEELFILGEPGVKTYFREKVRVPVDADPGLFAITISHQARGETKFIDALVEDLDLEPQKVPELAEKAGMRLFRARRADMEAALKRLSEHPSIEHAGAVVSMREQGFSHLISDIVARFRGPRIDAVREIAKENGYTLVRELVYAPSTYVLRWQRPATLDIFR